MFLSLLLQSLTNVFRFILLMFTYYVPYYYNDMFFLSAGIKMQFKVSPGCTAAYLLSEGFVFTAQIDFLK